MEQETGRISFGVARDWFKSWYQSPEQTPEEQLDIVKKARAERWAIWGLENGLETLIEKLDSNVTKQGVEIHYARSKYFSYYIKFCGFDDTAKRHVSYCSPLIYFSYFGCQHLFFPDHLMLL